MLGGMMLTASATEQDNLTICHNNNGVKDYVAVTIDTSAIDEKNNAGWNGHGNDNGVHGGDIIPPFGEYPGRNWTPENQAILANNCVVVVSEPSPTPTETTASPTPTTTKTPREETPTPTPTETTPTQTPPANPTPPAEPSASPSPSQSTPVASTSPTPEPSTPAASKTPKSSKTPPATKSNPPTTSTPKTPTTTTKTSTPKPKCTDVAKEQAGKTYAKDSPESNGVACVG